MILTVPLGLKYTPSEPMSAPNSFNVVIVTLHDLGSHAELLDELG